MKLTTGYRKPITASLDGDNSYLLLAGGGQKALSDLVQIAGALTISGSKTFSSLIYGNISGNAGSVTDGVYASTTLTITGSKTFSNPINGDILGNATTADRLKNSRTINGVAFDGSSNITITAAANGGTATSAGTATTAGALTNLTRQSSGPSWGTLASGYTSIGHWADAGGGGMALGYKSGQMSMQIDGKFYQNEGANKVLDSADVSTSGSGWGASMTVDGKTLTIPSRPSYTQSEISPTISKKYTGLYYATAADDQSKSAFFFISARPDSWYKPWKVRFRIRSVIPAATNCDSVSWVELYGRADSVTYKIYNERYDHAHYYAVVRILKLAGFNAVDGNSKSLNLGHAIGINLLYSNSYTNATYYRNFDLDYYDSYGCTVSVLDSPVNWSEWTNNSDSYYNGYSNYDAVSRGLQETGDNDSYAYNVSPYYRYQKAGANGVYGYNIITEDTAGCLSGFVKSRSTETNKIKNSVSFKVGSPLYYNTASGETSSGSIVYGYNIRTYYSLIDFRYSVNVASGVLTAYKPLYIKGLLNTDLASYTLPDTWWTQDLPTSEDGYVYIYLGMVYPDSSTYRISWEEYHPSYVYKSGAVRLIGGHASFAEAVKNGVYTTGNLTISGNKTFSGATSIDSLTAGNLIVSGAISGNLIGNSTSSDKVNHKLTFTGGVTGNWDGSSDKSIAIPTTLPASDVSSWAKASTKPSYTFQEVTSQVSVDQNNVTWAQGVAKTTRRGFIYNTSSTEYSYLFALSTSGEDPTYGTILKIGYADTYLRMLRVLGANAWKSTDWEKISAGYADSAGTSTYTSNVGTSGTAGTNYVTAKNVIDLYNWWTIATADSKTDTAINKWKEVEAFLTGITDTLTLTGLLAGRVAKTGDTMSGALVVDNKITANMLEVTGAATFNTPISGDLLGNATTADRLKNDKSGTNTTSGLWNECKIENGVIKYYDRANDGNNYHTLSLNGATGTTSGSISWYAPTGAGTNGQFLKSNGSGAPSWTSINQNVTSHLYVGVSGATGNLTGTATQADPYLSLVEGTTLDSQVLIKAGDGIEVKASAGGVITIKNISPDQNHNTDEKLKTIAASASTKYYLTAKSTAADTATGVTSTLVYLKDGKIYSNDSEVVTLAGTLTIGGNKTFSGTVTIDSLTGALNVGNATITGTLNVTGTSSIGTVTSGIWNGTRLTSSYLPTDTIYGTLGATDSGTTRYLRKDASGNLYITLRNDIQTLPAANVTSHLRIGATGCTTNATSDTTNTTTYLSLVEGSTLDSQIQVTGSGTVTVKAKDGVLTITGSSHPTALPANGGTSTYTQMLDRIAPVSDGHKVYFYSGAPVYETTYTTTGRSYPGSSTDYRWYSFPVATNGTADNTCTALNTTDSKANVMNLRFQWGTTYFHDLFMSPNLDDFWHRRVGDGTAGAWKKFLDSSNYSSYALPITGGTVTGDLHIANHKLWPRLYLTTNWSTNRDTVMIYTNTGASGKWGANLLLYFRVYSGDAENGTGAGSHYYAYCLPQVPVGLTEDKIYAIYTSQNFIAGTNYAPAHSHPYLSTSGGTLTGKLTLGATTQSEITNATGIHVHDIRNVSVTPDLFGDQVVNWYFDQQGPSGKTNWKGIMHMKGWTGNTFYAWELAGSASTSSEGLFYRDGCGSTWNDWKQVAFTTDIPTIPAALPANGGTSNYAYKLNATTPSTDDYRLYYYAGLVAYETTYSKTGNAYPGSSADYRWYSFPVDRAGTADNTSTNIDATSQTANIMNLRFLWDTTHFHDLFMSPNKKDIWHRLVDSSGAGEWKKILNSINYSDYALPITGGRIAKITGNALQSSGISDASIGLVIGGDLTASTDLPASLALSRQSILAYWKHSDNDDTDADDNYTYATDLYLNPYGGQVFVGPRKLAISVDGHTHPYLSVSGGTITGDVTMRADIGFKKVGTGFLFYDSATALTSVAYVKYSTNGYLSFYAGGKDLKFATSSGNNIIFGSTIKPNTNNNYDLGLTGTRFRSGYFGTCVYAASGFFQSSDIRLKNVLNYLDLLKSYDFLEACKPFNYEFKSNPGECLLGVSALEVELYFPEIVSTDEDGWKSVLYDKLAVILLGICKDLNNRLKVLEDKL